MSLNDWGDTVNIGFLSFRENRMYFCINSSMLASISLKMFTSAWRLPVRVTLISNAISSLTVHTAESALFISSLSFQLSLFSSHDMVRERGKFIPQFIRGIQTLPTPSCFPLCSLHTQTRGEAAPSEPVSPSMIFANDTQVLHLCPESCAGFV